MRSLAVAILLLAAPALAAPPHRTAARATLQDWTRTVVATPMGFRMGNPNAPVKLVEYGSFTCPHCRAFFVDGMATLRAKYLAGGRVNYEFRSFVRNGPDYGATLLAACGGAARFFPFADALFDKQPEWIKPFEAMTDADATKLNALPPGAQVAALARLGGLDRFAAGQGLPAARAQACLADKTAADRLTATLKYAVDTDHVDGTPGFLINGQRQTIELFGQTRGIVLWKDLEPKLVQALR